MGYGIRASPPYLFQSSPFERGGRSVIVETGGLFNSEKRMVSVLHKDLEHKVDKLKCKKVGGLETEDQNQIRTTSW